MISKLFSQKDKIGSLTLLLIAALFFVMSFDVPVDKNNTSAFTAQTFPMLLSGLLCICAILQLVMPSESPFDVQMRNWRWRPVFGLLVLMAAYALTFPLLGFVLGSMLFLTLGFRILGESNYLLSVLVAASLIGFLWVLLTQAFGLYLEPGELFQ